MTSEIAADLDRVAADFRDLLDAVAPTELHAPTNGTKWTNKQLLFHMLFGVLLVRTLVILVKGFGRLPSAVFHVIAAAMNAATHPFHLANYLCALPGSRMLSNRAMPRLMDSATHNLRASLARESEHTLALAMHFPIGWDPYFKEIMSVADVYEYATRYYDHHRGQLTTRRALEV